MKTILTVSLICSLLLASLQLNASPSGDKTKASSTLNGMITNEIGDGMSYVKVSLIDASGVMILQGMTDHRGIFNLDSVPSGEGYTVLLTRPGFTPISFENVSLQANSSESFMAYLSRR